MQWASSLRSIQHASTVLLGLTNLCASDAVLKLYKFWLPSSCRPKWWRANIRIYGESVRNAKEVWLWTYFAKMLIALFTTKESKSKIKWFPVATNWTSSTLWLCNSDYPKLFIFTLSLSPFESCSWSYLLNHYAGQSVSARRLLGRLGALCCCSLLSVGCRTLPSTRYLSFEGG